jgi:hypothetical protein
MRRAAASLDAPAATLLGSEPLLGQAAVVAGVGSGVGVAVGVTPPPPPPQALSISAATMGTAPACKRDRIKNLSYKKMKTDWNIGLHPNLLYLAVY